MGYLAPALAAALAVVPAAAAATTAPAASVETEVAATTGPATVATAATATAASAAAAVAAATTTVATAAATAEAAAAATTTARKRARLRLEAVAAVHRTIATGFEGDLCFFTARCADRIEQLPGRTAIGEAAATFSSAHCALPCPAAVGAAPGLTRKALRRMEFLFTRGERERLAAVAADERLVGVRHPMTLLKLPGTYGHRAPVEFVVTSP